MSTTQLRDALEKSHDAAANSVAELRVSAQDVMQDAGSRGRRYVDRAGRQASHAYDVARDRTTEGAEQAWDFVRSRPYTSIAIAAGLGVLVGGLLWARSRD
ncbi:MAG: hypothetical protein JWO31_1096 [Phycisphaerales bacterium]|nr:hypothetical protein [Phycisphaerales bacterium]